MKRVFLPLISGALAAAFLSFQPIDSWAAEPLDEAPNVSGTDQNGDSVDLGKLYQEGPVLVFFYPKADTPGCTRQACSLRDAYEELQQSGLSVIGVSSDGVEAQKAFANKFDLPFTLLADPDGEVMQAFEVERMGNGFATRQAFLINEGRVVWHDAKASTDQQAADVLEVLEELEIDDQE